MLNTYSLCSSSRFASMASSVCSANLKSVIRASQRDLVKSSRTTMRMSFICSECGAMVYAGTTQPRSRSWWALLLG